MTARDGVILVFVNFVSADEHRFAIETDIMAVYSTAAGKIVRQQTLKNSIHCSGVALHSGAKVNMVLHPAEADTGIVFRRTDAAGGVEVQALWCNAIETPLCTDRKSTRLNSSH